MITAIAMTQQEYLRDCVDGYRSSEKEIPSPSLLCKAHYDIAKLRERCQEILPQTSVEVNVQAPLDYYTLLYSVKKHLENNRPDLACQALDKLLCFGYSDKYDIFRRTVPKYVYSKGVINNILNVIGGQPQF